MDIQVMVRLSGKSAFYLPPDYAPCALLLPTCLRATAQHLAQSVTTRGIFRIPGSVRVVNALFDYYCYMDNFSVDVAGTVRGANLPVHIRCSVHDVASTFKRLLSVLPGGILGSLGIFDAFVAIHSQLLRGQPEFPRTKQTKVRARLIALAIGTIKSQFRRELVCAVFGLLSLIGRAAELTPREDDGGRPLPTGDLMGYGALGIIFGPLLVGDLLSSYSMRLATPSSGLLLFPLTPRKIQKDKRKSKNAMSDQDGHSVNKIHVANDIAEMLISNWRDVVRQMKALGVLHRKEVSVLNFQTTSMRPSASSDFAIKRPRDWEHRTTVDSLDRSRSPEHTPTMPARRQRPMPIPKRTVSSNRLTGKPSVRALSPTAEESVPEEDNRQTFEMRHEEPVPEECPESEGEWIRVGRKSTTRDSRDIEQGEHWGRSQNGTKSPPVSLRDVPPRTSSKPRTQGSGDRSFAYSAENISPYTSAVPARVSMDSKSGYSNRNSRILPAEMEEEPRGRSSIPAAKPRESRSSSAVRRPPQVPPHIPQRASYPVPNHRRLSPSPRRRGVTISEFENQQELNSLLHDLETSVRHASVVAEAPRHASAYEEPDVEEEHHFHAENIDRKITSYFHTDSPGSREDDDVTRDSIDATPTQFYSPMRVPTTLSHAAGHPATPYLVPSTSVPRLSKQQVRKVQPRGALSAKDNESTSKAGGVKAMAAIFDNPEIDRPTSRPKLEGRGWNIGSGSSNQTRATRTGDPGPSRQTWVGQGKTPVRDEEAKRLRTSVSDSVALKAAAIMEAEKQERMPKSPGRRPMATVKQVLPVKEPEVTKNETSRQPPNLGTMAPHPEQPPIAQYLNFVRPSSSASTGPEDESMVSQRSSMTPRPGSTSGLHSQIRLLKRQLDARADEVAQLKRQLEAQESSDVGTLSEQLREAKREVMSWRERAEAAERRVKVFERFTARLRGIREAAAAADQHEGREFEEEQISPSEHVIRPPQERSDDSRNTEEPGVVNERIRQALQGEDGRRVTVVEAGPWIDTRGV